MKKIYLSAAVVLSFAACADDQPEKDPSLVPSKTAIENIAPDTANKIPGNNNLRTAVQPQNIVPVSAPAPVKVAAGTNPAHGQPGHRCDIAVGAPLNSPVAKQGSLSSQPQVIPAPAAANVSNPAPVKTAPGMNPPHGEPGHRCDIAVGASLSSPVKAVPAVTPAATSPEAAPKPN